MTHITSQTVHGSMDATAMAFSGPMHSPKSGAEYIGCGVTKFYELLGAGLIEARKMGTRTLIAESSLRAYLMALPKAAITTGQRGAAK